MFSKSIFIWIFPSNLFDVVGSESGGTTVATAGAATRDGSDMGSFRGDHRKRSKDEGRERTWEMYAASIGAFPRWGKFAKWEELISCCELCFAGTNGFRLWGLMITWWPGLKARWINEVQTRWERLSIVEQQLLQAEQDLQELETLDKDPACWGSSFGVLWKYGSPFHGGEMCLCQ